MAVHLSLHFEAGRDARLVGRWPLNDWRETADRTEKVVLSSSFGALLIVVHDAGSHGVELLVDGVPVPLRSVGNLLISRLPLLQDIEFHRIAAVQMPGMACTVDVDVEHVYELPGRKSGVQRVTKWSIEDFRREYQRVLPLVSPQRVIVEDVSHHGAAVLPNDAQPLDVLKQVIAKLLSRWAGASTAELLADFANVRDGEIDRDAILSRLKADARRLLPDLHGCISIGTQRFTTDIALRGLTKSSDVDLKDLLAAIQQSAILLCHTTAPAIFPSLLLWFAGDLRMRFRPRSSSMNGDGSVILSRKMHSRIGQETQDAVRLIFSVALQMLKRDAARADVRWIEQGVRDFDVFQACGFLTVARAYGFSLDDISNSCGILTRDGVKIRNGNASGALTDFLAQWPGWRSKSIQPSGYRPDVVVELSGMSPVVLDSKFALPNSCDQALPSGPLKDVQAYMDEFSLCGAVILVPKLVEPNFCGPDGYVSIESGSGKFLLGVPVSDSDSSVTHAALRSAIGRLAAI